MSNVKSVCWDANTAATNVAYNMSEVCFIYPITPSSVMAEQADAMSADGKLNFEGNRVSVIQMQSEGGAAGAIHGAAVAGSLVTSFTASQGLMLMVPDLFRIAGEHLPAVLHVAARQVSTSTSSIFGEHSDVMATRHTGICILSSSSVQEAEDMAVVAHISALECSLPVLHFFDGFQLSHQLCKIKSLPQNIYTDLMPREALLRFRSRAASPAHPSVIGTLMGRDTMMQGVEAGSIAQLNAPAKFAEAMNKVSAITGRPLHLFTYYGHPEADRVVALMGAGTGSCIEAANYMNNNGAKVGVLCVHLFRPWSAKDFIAALPKTVKSIAVLDRTKEPGSAGEPLFLDVAQTLSEALDQGICSITRVLGGRYGLGDKAFTPAMAMAVFDNLASKTPIRHFTVGIEDDVLHTSLKVGPALHTVPEGTHQTIFWGFGSDGTVGACKNSIDLIANNTDMYAHGFFFFTAHKAGGVTYSHLRFGPKPLDTATYPIASGANFISVSHPAYVEKYPLADALAQNGIFLLNCPWADVNELAAHLPADLKHKLASHNAKIYIINANKVAHEAGLGGHTNVVMQAAFFGISCVVQPTEKAIDLLKQAAVKAYSKKGQEVVAKNIKAIEHSLAGIHEIKYDAAAWLASTDAPKPEPVRPFTEWVKKVKIPVDAMRGDELPVSTFTPGGMTPSSTTWQEKRCIATQIPKWNSASCVQCNTCAMLCPHAAIRPFLFEADEAAKAPKDMTLLPAKGLPPQFKDKNLQFRIQISSEDCTGCGVCSRACPVKDTLTMIPLAEDVKAVENEHWNYCMSLPTRTHWFDNFTAYKFSQFRQPLFEFSAACGGCGEGAYIKLLTQLFGERLVVANAAGCSSAISVTFGSCPYTTTPEGWGPTFRNSLFEENAEFGLGILKGHRTLRSMLHEVVKQVVADPATLKECGENLGKLIQEWLACFDDSEKSLVFARQIVPLLEQYTNSKNKLIAKMAELRDSFIKTVVWTMGGDGWAYDIDYGGLDHVLSMPEESRVIVLDTEVYSNTGGQQSKATRSGAVHKFAAAGKPTAKKDLAAIAMSYGHIYVAQICLDANPQQAMKALMEADAYQGPSLILCYCPCIEHGIEGGSDEFVAHAKLAVQSGYWPLFRFNPANAAKGKALLEVDGPSVTATTPEGIDKDIHSLLSKENRFVRLIREKPERAKSLHGLLVDSAASKWENLKRLAALPPPQKK